MMGVESGGRRRCRARGPPRNAARLRGRCGGRGGTRRGLSSSGMRASAAESSARHSALGSVHRMAAGVAWPVGVEVRARRLRARWSRGVAGRRSSVRISGHPSAHIDVSDCVLSVYDVRINCASTIISPLNRSRRQRFMSPDDLGPRRESVAHIHHSSCAYSHNSLAL